MSFETALKHVLSFEGGYANSLTDAGGETFRGISRVSNPDWAGWAVIDSVKADLQAKGKINFHNSASWPLVDKAVDGNPVLKRLVSERYEREYYRPVLKWGLDQAATDKLFDIRVNCGPKTGARILQRAVNRSGDPAYNRISVDGAVGPLTLAAAKRIDGLRLAAAVAKEQEAHYVKNIIPKYPNAKDLFLKRARWLPEADNA
jgi:lysozyme family protein